MDVFPNSAINGNTPSTLDQVKCPILIGNGSTSRSAVLDGGVSMAVRVLPEFEDAVWLVVISVQNLGTVEAASLESYKFIR